MESSQKTQPQIAATILLNDIQGQLNKHKLTIDQYPYSPGYIGEMAYLESVGMTTRKETRKWLAAAFEGEEQLENAKLEILLMGMEAHCKHGPDFKDTIESLLKTDARFRQDGQGNDEVSRELDAAGPEKSKSV